MPVPAPLASKPLPAQTYDPAYDTATKQATTEIDLASKPVQYIIPRTKSQSTPK